MVPSDNTCVTDLSTDLDGDKVGSCSPCTYDFFLQKKLEIEGFEFDFIIDDAVITGYDTDTTALQDLALGDGPARRGHHVADHGPGLHRRREPGEDRRRPGVLRAAGGRASTRARSVDGAAWYDAVNEIVAEMHADGTLTSLSEQWYGGVDLTIQQQVTRHPDPGAALVGDRYERWSQASSLGCRSD